MLLPSVQYKKAVMVLAVIEKITRKCHEIEQALNQGICGEREHRSIDSCGRNLERIEHLLSPDTNDELRNSLGELRMLITATVQADEDRSFSVRRISSGESVYYGIHIMYIDYMYVNFFLNLWRYCFCSKSSLMLPISPLQCSLSTNSH